MLKKNSAASHVPPHFKLNILTLPSFTSLLLGLIIFVVLGATFSSILPDSQMWWPPFVLGIIFLPLRDFLHWPGREMRHRKLTPISAYQELTILQTVMDDLSKQARTSTLKIYIDENSSNISSFGTFRRRFLRIGSDLAEDLATNLRSENVAEQEGALAILSHELAHFINHDIQFVGYARDLLKIAFLVSVLALWGTINFTLMMVEFGHEFTLPETWITLGQLIQAPVSLLPLRDSLRNANPAMFDLIAQGFPDQRIGRWIAFQTSNVYLPFIISAVILYIFFWRKMLRVRELYADARTASLLGKSEAILTAISLFFRSKLTIKNSTWLEKLRPRFLQFSILQYHPSYKERYETLANPIHVFGKAWQLAAWTGFAVMMLDNILRSSVTVLYIVQPGSYLPLLTASMVFSLWLLPHLCQGDSLRTLFLDIVKMILVFIAIKLSVLMLDGLYLLIASLGGFLGQIGHMLDLALALLFGIPLEEVPCIIGCNVSWGQLVRWQIIEPLLYYVVFGIPSLVIFLLTDSWIKAKILTWYALESRVKQIFVLVTTGLLLLQALIFIPVANRLLLPEANPNWTGFVFLGIGIGVLLAGVGSFLLMYIHRRLAQRCPKCHNIVSGSFSLGKQCPHCSTILHSWLLAPYT